MRALGAALLLAGIACGCGEGAEAQWQQASGESDGRYTLHLALSRASPPTGAGSLRVRVEPRAGWHLEPSAPASLALDAPPGLDFDRASQRRDDASVRSRERLEFATGFRSQGPTAAPARGRLKFGLCQGEDERCFIVRREFELSMGAGGP